MSQINNLNFYPKKLKKEQTNSKVNKRKEIKIIVEINEIKN